jgi:CRP-like cAMP-binding protein
VSPVLRQLIAALNQCILDLPIDTRRELDKALVPKQYQKNEFLLQAGEASRFSFWVEKGVVRKYYLADDKEIVTELCFENDLAVSFGSYLTQGVGHEYLQAVSEVKALRLDYQAFQLLSAEHPALLKLDLLLTQLYAVWLEERLMEFHTLDAAARYEKLQAEQPVILQQIPLTYVASYLGISLETLSRIRARKRPA